MTVLESEYAGLTTKRYKGYVGSIEIDCSDDELGIYCGRILGIRDLVTYRSPVNDGTEARERSFREAVDAYLEICHWLGRNPQPPSP